MRILLTLLLASVALTASESPFKPVATVQQVMEIITAPASDVIFDYAADAPKTDEAWTRAQTNALALAESGNLLMIPGRARDEQEWMNESQAMIDAAMQAFKAAEARNTDMLTAAGDKIYVTCEKCHDTYMGK
jgi:hypothetical protein